MMTRTPRPLVQTLLAAPLLVGPPAFAQVQLTPLASTPIPNTGPLLPLHEENLVLATIEDQNGNGYDDFLVGLPLLDQVHVLDGHKLKLHRVIRGPAGSRFGVSLAVLPDQNGDGLEDVAIGAPDAMGSGAVYVHRGRDYGLLKVVTPTQQPTICVAQNSSFDEYGMKVAVGADFNGDGRAELIVGDPGWDSIFWVSNNFGYMEVVSVAGSGPPTLVAWTRGEAHSRLGRSIETVKGRIVVNGSPTTTPGQSKLDVFDPFYVPACNMPSIGAGRAPGVGQITLGYAMTTIPAAPGSPAEDLLASSLNTGGGSGDVFRYTQSSIVGLPDGSPSTPVPPPDFLPVLNYRDPWNHPSTFGSALSRLPGSGDFDGDGRTDFVVGNAPPSGLAIPMPSSVGIASFTSPVLLAELRNENGSTQFGQHIASSAKVVPGRLNVVVSDPALGLVHLY